MIHKLGFPKGLISVERKSLERRTDIVCYTPEGRALLLVECKAVSLTQETLQQALGYNAIVQAPFICLVNHEEIKTFWQEKELLTHVPFLPKYVELYERIRRN
jgi:hypothetical protein